MSRPTLRVTLACSIAVTLLAGCGATTRHPRPTILTAENPPPPPPPPEANEERLEPQELRPGAPDPVETAPGQALATMARRALDGAQYDLIACYSEILPEHPDADGSIELQIDLSNEGGVVRVTVDQLARGGLDQAVPCVQRVVQALRVRDVQPHGHYVSRVYTFHNPPIERVGASPVTITPPPRPARAAHRRRQGAATSAPAAEPSSSPSPAPSRPGALTVDEIPSTITAASSALATCYGNVLRRAHAAAGRAQLTLDVTGRGEVENAQFASSVGSLVGANRCFTDAARSIRFRASGTHTHITQALTFHR